MGDDVAGSVDRDESYVRLDASGQPSPKVRKRLAMRSGNLCAFPDCDRPLENPAPVPGEGTILGVECHIVPRSDSPKVARAPCLLTKEERDKWTGLIEDRHGFDNLVLMCSDHAKFIDALEQGLSVADVVQMKLAHEAAVLRKREELKSAIDEEAAEAKSTPQARPILLDDVGHWQAKAIRALAEVDAGALEWLRGEVGGGGPDVVPELITRWPDELRDGPRELLVALAREAEAGGHWGEAATVWIRTTERAEAPQEHADGLVRAAIDADVGGDQSRSDLLLQEAEELDPDSIRLRLQRIADSADPLAQLEQLGELETDDDALSALIAAQKTLAFLLLEEIESAERELSTAQALEPDSISTQAARVNLEVQKARLALRGDRAFSMAGVLRARDDALELRRKLLEMQRLEESSRLLMLAADVMSLLRDLEGAKAILEQVEPGELDIAPLGPEVLGDAALRCDAPELALQFTDGAEETDVVVRIRATAEADLGGPPGEAALQRLEQLALAGSEESEFAAASRLLACIPPVAAEWNEEVATVLEGGPHALQLTKLRAMVMVRTDEQGAKALALEQPHEPWAAELRLRIGGLTKDSSMTKAAAEEFRGFGPDASGLILIGQGFAQIDEFDTAAEVLTGVMRDPNSPPQLRSDACDLLMSALADNERWAEAKIVWNEWSGFATAEVPSAIPRINEWHVRVANRNRQ